MANLHRAREMIVAAYVCDILDDVEFILLHDMHTPTNVDFQHENDDSNVVHTCTSLHEHASRARKTLACMT